MKLFHQFKIRNSGLQCYALYGEIEPTILAKKPTRFFKLYRVDPIVPYKLAYIMQTTTDDNNSSFEYKLFDQFKSEEIAVSTAINWLKNEWDGKL